MGGTICRIERLQNGFEVEMYDPDIAAKNNLSKGVWREPMVAYAFKSVEEVIAFLGKSLDKAVVSDEYASSFDKLVGEEADE